MLVTANSKSSTISVNLSATSSINSKAIPLDLITNTINFLIDKAISIYLDKTYRLDYKFL